MPQITYENSSSLSSQQFDPRIFAWVGWYCLMNQFIWHTTFLPLNSTFPRGSCKHICYGLLYFSASQRVKDNSVGFQVFTAVIIKSSIFWNVTSCSPVSQSTFRRNISPSPHGLRVSQARSKQQADSSTLQMEVMCSSETMVDYTALYRRR
jgi:hypothetical protein